MRFVQYCLMFIVMALVNSCDARTLKVTPNPGCATNCTDTDLRLLQVDSVDGTTQNTYLISTFGPPTIFCANFNVTADTTVDWECIKHMGPDCITFSKKPTFTSSVFINRLIEYDDTPDTSDVTRYAKKPHSVRNVYLSSVNWAPVVAAKYDSPEWTLVLNSTYDTNDIVNQNSSDGFTIKFEIYDSKDRTSMMPNIAHSDTSGVFDMVMSNLKLHFNSSRFAFEIVTVSDALPDSSSVTEMSSVDDEYSPGVFEVETWLLNIDAASEMQNTYVHYKPVSYTKPIRNLESIQPAKVSKVRFFNYDDLRITNSLGLTYAYYGDDIRLRGVQSANISIGSFQDGFYTAYNYTTFTAIVGIGEPVYDSMSIDVIIAIAIGVGIPVTLIVVSVTIVLYRMIKNRNAGSTEELLVNEQ